MTQKKNLTISGWGQDQDLISNILDLPCDSLDYTNKKISDVIDDISLRKQKYDCIIGWSLGGQIALELSKYIAVNKLILVSTPYKFISSETYDLGIKEKEFKGFQYLLKKNKQKLLEHFRDLIMENNVDKEQLSLSNNNTQDLLCWLEFLGQFNGNNNFPNIDNIMLIYGKLDKIVKYQQGELYLQKFNNASLEIFPLASHIPFLHDTRRFNQLVRGFINE